MAVLTTSASQGKPVVDAGTDMFAAGTITGTGVVVTVVTGMIGEGYLTINNLDPTNIVREGTATGSPNAITPSTTVGYPYGPGQAFGLRRKRVELVTLYVPNGVLVGWRVDS